MGHPVGIESLAVFRVAFGSIAALSVLRYLAYGWVYEFFVAPTVFFPYAGFEWLRPMPAPAMYALYAALFALSIAIALGWHYRIATVGFLIGFGYSQLIDRSNYLNHYYLIFLVAALMCILPAHRRYSLDCRLGRVRPAALVPAWCVWILRFQIGVVYVFGAIAKLNPDWLLRAQPMRIWLGGNVDLPLVGPLLHEAWIGFLFSYAGIAFDALVVPALLWSRSRPYAYVSVLVFHVCTRILFPIGVFPWMMIALTPIFFEPDWPKTLFGRVSCKGFDDFKLESVARPIVRGRLGAVLVATYVLVQLVMPLRSWMLPGSTYWYEDGFRFSWQIMSMEKYGRISFTVSDPAGDQQVWVNPADHLTRLQLRMMATQPDMIVSFARFAEQTYSELIDEDVVEVHADSFASLNGRPHQRFVDPGVDLLALEDGAPRSGWIVPLAY